MKPARSEKTAAADPGMRPESFRTLMGPLLLLTTIFFLNFMARIIQAPLMPAIEAELGISHGVAGSLFFTISIGYFISLIGSGFVSARLKHRGVIILSSLSVGLILMVIAASSSLWAIRGSLVVLGLAAGLYLPSGIATLTGFVGRPHWGKAIAIHELAPNLSFVAAPLFARIAAAQLAHLGIITRPEPIPAAPAVTRVAESRTPSPAPSSSTASRIRRTSSRSRSTSSVPPAPRRTSFPPC